MEENLINVPSNETVQDVFGVSMGYFAERSYANNALIGTNSLGSCFAFVKVNETTQTIYLAHVATDGETKGLLEQAVEANCSYFYVTGEQPNPNSTQKRIDNLKKHFGGKQLGSGTTGVAVNVNAQTNKLDIRLVSNINFNNDADYNSQAKRTRGFTKNAVNDPLDAM